MMAASKDGTTSAAWCVDFLPFPGPRCFDSGRGFITGVGPGPGASVARRFADEYADGINARGANREHIEVSFNRNFAKDLSANNRLVTFARAPLIEPEPRA